MTSFNRKDQALQWIKLSALSVRWPQAQRPFDERRAKKIAAAFNPDSFTPVIVSLPDAKGMHHIIDGQHRCGAARIALGADQSVPCEVVNVDTPEDAARIFGVINNDRAAVSAIDKFRNAVTEGRPLHVAVEKLLTQMGYRIATGKGEGIINAIGTCVLVAEQHRTEGLRDTLLMIQGAWAKECGSVAHDVRKWAIEHGDDPLLRIALCGYDGEHEMPGEWECLEWKAKGGYGS